MTGRRGALGPARVALAVAVAQLGPAPCQTSRLPVAWDYDPGDATSMRLAGGAVDACRTACPAQAECLAVALEGDERYGIWGGTVPDERPRLRRQRAAG
jgi:hypothetical protein